MTSKYDNARLSAAVRKAFEILGDETVIIPVPRGTKGTRTKGWPALRPDDMIRPGYLECFKEDANIAVVLGAASNGLCTMDLDTDKLLSDFLWYNQDWVGETLITKGKRGGNVWVRITGGYPPLTVVPEVGEWRSDKAYTIFSGLHPEGALYTFVQEKAPISIPFSHIIWPPEIEPYFKHFPLCSFYSSESLKSEKLTTEALEPEKTDKLVPETYNSDKLKTGYCNTGKLKPDDCVPDNCVTKKAGKIIEVLAGFENAEAKVQAWKSDPANRALVMQYEQQVERYFHAQPGARNRFIVDAAARLFYAVSEEVALALIKAFYDIHESLFKDSVEQHMREAGAMFDALEKTYLSQLDPETLEVYRTLSGKTKAAFRILRDLAIHGEGGTLFLSVRELGERIGCDHMTAFRMLKAFECAGVISTAEKQPAGARMAKVFKWTMHLPPPNLAEEGGKAA